MTPIQVDCTLYHNHEEGRLYAVCKTPKTGIVVSASDHEIVNSSDTVIKDLILSALEETNQFTSFMVVASNIEVVDPATMRFILDAKVEANVYMYRKCNHCCEEIVSFIERMIR